MGDGLGRCREDCLKLESSNGGADALPRKPALPNRCSHRVLTCRSATINITYTPSAQILHSRVGPPLAPWADHLPRRHSVSLQILGQTSCQPGVSCPPDLIQGDSSPVSMGRVRITTTSLCHDPYRPVCSCRPLVSSSWHRVLGWVYLPTQSTSV